MNAPVPHCALVRLHLATVESRHPVEFIGLLPRGSAGHVFDENALHFPAEKRDGLTLFGLAAAEIDLAELVGCPVGIVLVSGLTGREVQEFPAIAEPV